MAIEWAVYKRGAGPFKAEPYHGIKHLMAISASEAAAREFALNQNESAAKQEKIAALIKKSRGTFAPGRENGDGR